MKKIVFTAVCLSLVGCGGGGGSSSPSTNTPNSVVSSSSASLARSASSLVSSSSVSSTNSSANTLVNKPLALGAGTFSIRLVPDYNAQVGILVPIRTTAISINEITGAVTYHKNTLKGTSENKILNS